MKTLNDIEQAIYGYAVSCPPEQKSSHHNYLVANAALAVAQLRKYRKELKQQLKKP